jgi:hypothetical protein
MNFEIKWKQKYHTVGIVSKSIRKMVETWNIDTLNTQIYDRSLSNIYLKNIK